MIKRSTTKKKPNQKISLQQVPSIEEDSDNEGGFSKWLQTNEGAKLMWYFIIGNSAIVFLTMTWPKLQQVTEIIASMFED